MTIPGSANPLLMRSAAPTAYQVERSLRFNSSDSGFCSRTPSSAGDRKKWTWAAWVKRSALSVDQSLFSAYTGSASDEAYTDFFFSSDNTLRLGGWFTTWRTTTQVFRDTSAWYHIVLAVDIANATANDRVKLYVNGAQVTTFSTTNNPATTSQFAVNSTSTHNIGANAYYTNTTNKFSGYIADCYFIDSQALDPTSFTEVSATTGQLIPKAYTGTFGTNGFWLKFSDNSAATATTLGKDYSPNGNNWTPNNLSVTAGAGNDSLVDTPTSYGTDTGAGGEVRGNYCTWNPIGSGSGATLTNGNLDYSLTGASSAARQSRGTFLLPTSGKWYWECTATTTSEMAVGVVDFQTGQRSLYYRYDVGGFQNIYINDSQTAAVAGYTNNDVIGIGYDADNQQIRWYKNGAQVGTNYSLTNNGRFVPCAEQLSGSGTCIGSANFGQRPFAYTAPSGFKALCDTNLPAPVVAKGSSAFDVKLYTGNGGTNAITGLGFSPDFVWLKTRSAAGYYHVLQDVIRGTGPSTGLYSNATDAEGTNSVYHNFVSFDSAGFTVGANTPGFNNIINKSGETFVAWTWDAGTTTASNPDGSISSQVRANASAGFSIVTYTGNGTDGATVGHGLGVTPGMVIVKRRNVAQNWVVAHSGITLSTQSLALNLTTNATSFGDGWIDAWSSTTFTTNQGASSIVNVNANTGTYVAYCFAPVAGYSSAFSYTGNGSSDGPMVWLGFRPKLVLLKCSSSTSNWFMYDAVRNTYNVVDLKLYADQSLQENGVGGETLSTNNIDILSNGFKLRSANGSNSSSASYIGFAWAENPFQYARAR